MVGSSLYTCLVLSSRRFFLKAFIWLPCRSNAERIGVVSILVTLRPRILTALLTLLIGTSVFAASANAQTGIVSIRFRGLTNGDCFIGYGAPGPGYPSPYDWLGIGRGSVSIDGHAEAVPLEDPSLSYLKVLGDTYVSESLSTHGTASLNWVEKDGSKNQLVATLYPDASTEGIFVPEGDHFSVPLGGPNAGPVALKFRGIRTGDHVVQKMEGMAVLYSMPLAFSPANPHISSIRIVHLLLVDLVSGKLFMAIWLSEAWQIPIYGGVPESPSILVPAAKILQSKVEIKP